MNYEAESKNRLLNIIRKKITTAVIGALSAIDNSEFGNLIEANDNLYNEWQEVRNRILTNGNNQIRALEKEIEQYNIKWNRHNYKLPLMSRDEYLKKVKELKEERNV